MTQITFEAATLVDAINKATRVAPTRAGDAFDKAWGIVLDIYPDDEVKCVIRATNLDVYYTEGIDCISVSGESTRWRLPSQVLSSVLRGIPISAGRSVTFKQDGGKILISSMRLKATMMLADTSSFQEWPTFDVEEMTPVTGLGHRLAQVEWAASSDRTPPFCGVLLTGEHLMATNRYILARTPCKVDLPKPTIIPAGSLVGIIKAMGDTNVALSNGMLLLSPDAYTQIQTISYDMTYPPVQKIISIALSERIELHKAQLSSLLEAAIGFAASNRSSSVKLYIGKGELAVLMENDEIGNLGNVIDLPGLAPHSRKVFSFNPKYLTDSLNKCPTDKIVINYSLEEAVRPIHISSGDLDVWIVPLTDIPPAQ